MRVRLAAYPFVTVKGVLPKSSPKPTMKVAGRRRPQRKVPSRRMPVHTKKLWEATWCALISCGVGTRKGAWEIRKWVSLASDRMGWEQTARSIKDVCNALRTSALEGRRATLPATHHFPRRLLSFLNHRLTVKGKLAFSRLSRALPAASDEMKKEAVSAHAFNLQDRHVTPKFLLESIEEHVRSLLKGAFQQTSSYSTPSSAAAVVEKSRKDGGFNGVLAEHARAGWRGVGKGLTRGGRTGTDGEHFETSKLAAHFEHATQHRIRSDKFTMYPTSVSAERNLAFATAHLLRSAVGKQVVHHASVVAELGMKARVLTLPPAAVFAQGDLVRQVLWPALVARIPQILPYAPHTEEAILQRLGGFVPGRVYLSADLTKATDGFGHDAILAVVKGLRRAGFPSHLASQLESNLGVGHDVHYVRYNRSQLTKRAWLELQQRYPVNEDGETINVPKQRGTLMGTPCSFSILSILNHWMSDRLGSRRIICGDDLAAITHPDNVSSYSQRAAAIGSELHQGKSFRSQIGFVFCEAYALLSREGGLKSFRPPSLKEFVRDGNGVMCQHAVDPSSFNRLARCARTLYKRQRAIATKKGRFPELPAVLGGLGHPCKGKLKVPAKARAWIRELYLCENPAHNGPHDPTRWLSVLSYPAVPLDRKGFRERVSQVRAWLDAKKIDEPQPGDKFSTNREISAYSSLCANLTYLAGGGRFRKVRPQEIKVSRQRWPKPQDGCRGGVLSSQTRINTVLDWDRRARSELGTYLDAPLQTHIRRRICAHREGDLPGDDR
uniref:RNA-dependent RNA polymerase n=1 Tax=Plasmopara viticola lesion associated narnavirus 23 TaxID=2719507 RepID=A0A6G9RW97_9VIRU|nr:RNA-dependent RNA polymerase [Plasmopara viticola lesion associated narnavirus 23]